MDINIQHNLDQDHDNIHAEEKKQAIFYIKKHDFDKL